MRCYDEIKIELEKMGFKNVKYTTTGLSFSSDTLDMFIYHKGLFIGLTLGTKGSTSTISFGNDVKGCLEHLARFLKNEKGE